MPKKNGTGGNKTTKTALPLEKIIRSNMNHILKGKINNFIIGSKRELYSKIFQMDNKEIIKLIGIKPISLPEPDVFIYDTEQRRLYLFESKWQDGPGTAYEKIFSVLARHFKFHAICKYLNIIFQISIVLSGSQFDDQKILNELLLIKIFNKDIKIVNFTELHNLLKKQLHI